MKRGSGDRRHLRAKHPVHVVAGTTTCNVALQQFETMDAQVVVEEFRSKGLEVDDAAAKACACSEVDGRTNENEAGASYERLTHRHVRAMQVWRCVRT